MIFTYFCEYSQAICRFGMYRLWEQFFHFDFSIFSTPHLSVDSACVLGSPMFAKFSSGNFSPKFRSKFSRRFSGCRVKIFPSVFRTQHPEKTLLSSWGTLYIFFYLLNIFMYCVRTFGFRSYLYALHIQVYTSGTKNNYKGLKANPSISWENSV